MDEMESLWITVPVGEALRQAREKRGLSQSELAALVQASQSQIAKYEKGELSMPLSRLFAIASALDITVAELFQGA